MEIVITRSHKNVNRSKLINNIIKYINNPKNPIRVGDYLPENPNDPGMWSDNYIKMFVSFHDVIPGECTIDVKLNE